MKDYGALSAMRMLHPELRPCAADGEATPAVHGVAKFLRTSPDQEESRSDGPQDGLRMILRKLLLEGIARRTLIAGVLAAIVLAFATFADDWYERPTGTLWAPSGITVYGLRHQRRLSDGAVLYTDLVRRICDPVTGDQQLREEVTSRGARRELSRVQEERQIPPADRAKSVLLPDPLDVGYGGVERLRVAQCDFVSSVRNLNQRFAWGLSVTWAAWAMGIVATVCWRCPARLGTRIAGATFCATDIVLLVSWAMHHEAIESDVAALRRELARLGEDGDIAVAAVARATEKLYAPGLHMGFSSVALPLVAAALTCAGILAFAADLKHCCRRFFVAMARWVSGVRQRLKPLGHLFEKHIVGHDDFDKKNNTYVNKHESLGQPLLCCRGSKTCNRTLSALRDLFRHQVRAFESMGFMHSLVSHTEKATLDRHGVKDQMAQNFMAWRLSVLVLTASCGLLVLVLRPIIVLLEEVQDRRDEKVHLPNRLADWENASYANYTADIVQTVVAIVDYKVTEGALWLELAHYSAELFAWIMCSLGLACWVYFGTSRKYVVAGWLILLFSPFAITLIPIKQLVNLNAVGPVLDEWVAGTTEYFHLEDKIEACSKFAGNEDTVEDQVARMEKMCRKLAEYDGSWSLWLTGINLADARAACDTFQSAKDSKYIDKVMKSIQKLCSQLNDALGFSRDAEARSMLAQVRGQLNVYLEVYLSARCALGAYKMMVPAALAFGPGLVRASWKLKLLFPLARLPGTLVILLPAMYCPLLWMTYQFFFQVLANWLLLLALVVISFAPMIYSLVGVLFDLQNPVLSRPRLARILRHGRFWRIWVQRIGYVLIITWLLLVETGKMDFMDGEGDTSEEKEFKRQLFLQLRQRQIKWFTVPMQPVLFVVSWSFKFFFTKAAGMDFLIQQLASDYAFEKCVEVVANIPDEDLENPEKLPTALRGVPVPERIAETRQLEVDRKRIGEALVKMTLNEVAETRTVEDGEVAPLGPGTADVAFQRFAPELAHLAQMEHVAQNPFFQSWQPHYYFPFAYNSYQCGGGHCSFGMATVPAPYGVNNCGSLDGGIEMSMRVPWGRTGAHPRGNEMCPGVSFDAAPTSPGGQWTSPAPWHSVGAPTPQASAGGSGGGIHMRAAF